MFARRTASVAIALSLVALPAPPAAAHITVETAGIPAQVAARTTLPRADRWFERRAAPVQPVTEATVTLKVVKTKPSVKKPAVKQAKRPAPKKTTVEAMPVVASGRAATVISVALQQVGKPYVWGAAGPGSFDCSGLIMYAMARVGIRLPHQSDAIGRMGRAVPQSQWQPGTVISYGGHVALYIGSGRMVEAAHAGVPVRVTTVRPGNGRWLF